MHQVKMNAYYICMEHMLTNIIFRKAFLMVMVTDSSESSLHQFLLILG